MMAYSYCVNCSLYALKESEMANWWPFQACERAKSPSKSLSHTAQGAQTLMRAHLPLLLPISQLSHILRLCISPSRAVFLLSSLLGPGLWVKNGNNVQVGAVRPRLVSGLCICKDLSPRAALSPLLPLWGQSPENIWATPPPAGTSSLVQYAGILIMPIWDINTFYWYKKCWPPVLSHCHVVCNAKMQLTKLRHSANKKHSCKK